MTKNAHPKFTKRHYSNVSGNSWGLISAYIHIRISCDISHIAKLQRTSMTLLLMHDSYATVFLSVYKLKKNFDLSFYDEAFSESVSWCESVAWSDDMSLFCFLLSNSLVVHKVNVHIVTTQETFGADNVLLSHMSSCEGLQVERTGLQGCSSIILFCPISSHVGSDMKAVMKKLSDKLISLITLWKPCYIIV